MRPRTVICAILIVCTSWVGTPEAAAQSREAVTHYERGREHYQAGRYPEAAEELERAHALDPESPTLAYNLARVYELMNDFERAVFYYSRLIEMTPPSDEQHVSALAALERVRGARAAIDTQRAADEAAQAEREAEDARQREEDLRLAREQATIETETRLRVRGRADAAFYASAFAGIGALGGGTVLGLYALRRDNEADDWVVGPNHTARARSNAQASARRMAIGADLLLGTGVAAGVSALLLYYLRERHPHDETARSLRLTIEPTARGATLHLGGLL
jgi:tetratricopeptide (TPR) repeat protein